MHVTVTNPDDPYGSPAFDGPIERAGHHLQPGSYEADFDHQRCGRIVVILPGVVLPLPEDAVLPLGNPRPVRDEHLTPYRARYQTAEAREHYHAGWAAAEIYDDLDTGEAQSMHPAYWHEWSDGWADSAADRDYGHLMHCQDHRSC
ncbi:hypothetical protein CGZ93_10475 [Enemella dayhoffiae]|uniref:Uncharacterized protein n=1 Tax=Enemella dayhoffiae TaxID=2016507 RepID=A0A255H4N8_9ACTN|nr:hypothetical protein [Enemella dayhoffiae]OYO21494.1 hypothetical protein CGZ93_10475 [Enemella dayhoffiae]